ncbi:hypothetical protein MLD38_026618 [Melastoma candidum]|uniref:Uncharacterized protein n=1 Tax=Melastoma candidum TaxID=119954 RepID=A0ACB9NZ47_9MYRT|nr:hypothetical protein MLD38_026618 [Melastoma candidum]
MDFLSKRSNTNNNYTLLSQYPDDSLSKPDRNPPPPSFDWDSSDPLLRPGRIGSNPTSYPLQRESSGSSFGESSLSGEYYAPTLSATTTADPSDGAGFAFPGHEDSYGRGLADGRFKGGSAGTAGGGGSSGKSWAQQTEESYQLQLALALRLSNEATCADDPSFLDPVPEEAGSRGSGGAAEVVSHRFWVNGCLSYSDKIPDGFYSIHGMDPYVWTLCTDLLENGRVPSLESLKSIDPSSNPSIEAVLIDRRSDPSLKELQNGVLSLSSSCITAKEIVDHLAKLVCNLLGGSTAAGEDNLLSVWMECSHDLKDCLGSIVVPIGSLSVGLCRHRALLFKVLADIVDLPCRIARGCNYCTRGDASSCLVRFGLDREYLVDLIQKPGHLCEPNSILNGPSSIMISSPLRFPRPKTCEPSIDFSSLAKQYFADFQVLNIVFDNSSSDIPVEDTSMGTNKNHQLFERSGIIQRSSSMDRNCPLPMLGEPTQEAAKGAESNQLSSFNPQNVVPIQSNARMEIGSVLGLPDPRGNVSMDSRFTDGSIGMAQEISLDIEDLRIPWSDLVLKEKIGSGSFGTVHRADWHGSDVAVKILMEQEFHGERFKEFLREVAVMKRLRHPNIVLFMGAVTESPNLSIVTEYLSRGSLYRLLHRPGPREMLDERRRLSMAFDVAKGMNYLHKRNPPVVHRDLKSPNLLVDKKYTVKVCDFGLSRLKARTFLSSKSAAGTPEWMAPEVLRDEPSNEKSDVYSFGVILWELATLQQPWSNLNPAQVVAAVGFKGRRLEIPRDVNPRVASIIEACWLNEPWKRPSFSSIMESLRSLIKPLVPQPSPSDLPT